MLGHLMGFMGFHGGFWREKNNPQRESLSVEGYFWGRLCWANVGLFWVYVGPMLGHLVAFFGFHGSFRREETNPNGTACPLRFILGDFFRLCRANVGAVLGLCWAHAGSFDGLLGFHGGF